MVREQIKQNWGLCNYLEEMGRKNGNRPDAVVRGEPALTRSHFGVINKLDNSWDP